MRHQRLGARQRGAAELQSGLGLRQLGLDRGDFIGPPGLAQVGYLGRALRDLGGGLHARGALVFLLQREQRRAGRDAVAALDMEVGQAAGKG